MSVEQIMDLYRDLHVLHLKRSLKVEGGDRMSDMTKDQLDAGFIHQVRMYQGVGRERMHRIVNLLFFERARESCVAADALEICVMERLEKEG